MTSKLLYIILTSLLLPYFLAWFVLKVIPWWRNPSLPLLIDGFVAEGFENVREVFRTNIEEKCNGGGGSFSVYHQGKLIINLWGGYADSETFRPWGKNTLAVVFSTTKGIVALCVAVLVDRGLLDYDDLVTKYWPEFGQNGKENVTVKMLMNHQAGLLALERPLELSDFHNPALMKKLLQQAKPFWPPGTEIGYHVFTYGQFASQLIQQVDPKHRTVGQFFKEELAQPFGIDFHIGLSPEEFHRMARFWEPEETVVKLMERIMDNEILSLLSCVMNPKSLMTKANRAVNLRRASISTPEWLEIELPSVNGVGTAQALAKFYGFVMNENKVKEHPILTKNTISKLLLSIVSGKDILICKNVTGAYGLCHSKDPYKDQNLIIGHPGLGGQYAGGDFQRKIGFAFVSNVLSSDVIGRDPRVNSLVAAVYQSLDKLVQIKK